MRIDMLIFYFFFFLAACVHGFQDKSSNNIQSGFLAQSSSDKQEWEVRTLTEDNNFNVDDFSSSSDFDGSDVYVPIMALSYSGTWNATNLEQDTQQFSFFNYTFGSADFTANEDYTNRLDNNIVFRFYDGQYKDQKTAVVNFVYDNATDFDPATSTFQNNSIIFEVYTYDHSDSEFQLTCEGSYLLSFIDSATRAPYKKMSNDYESVYAEFWLNSTNCSISVYAIVAIDSTIKASKAMNYAIMIIVICIAHLYACIKMSKDIIMNEATGNRFSLLTLGFFSGWDVFLCLFHLYSALTVDDFFPAFVLPAFCYFVLVSIFETRLILLVWKARYYAQLVATDNLRRGLMIFYLKFYGFLSLFLLICYFVIPATWFLYVTSFFFIPQIVHNAIRGQRYKFNATYSFLLGFFRIVLPLYVKVCPVSIYKLTPDPIFGYSYTAIVILQILVLFLQSKLGTRFFVPSYCLPARYNYYVNVRTGVSEDEVESCPICMDGLNQLPSNAKTGLMDLRISKTLKIMQTPCKHQFHEQCLKDWMDVKLECPFCRSALPPLE